MEEIKLSKTQKSLYEYILKEYQKNGKFTATNRQLGIMFSRTAQTMQYNLKALRKNGLVDCTTVIEDSGYVIRYVTPKNV
ncbi:MAG: hypothetical protein LUD19_02890 [Clostridia bacterium]|nr:hypothetical protein [Clostridia bacterium]